MSVTTPHELAEILFKELGLKAIDAAHLLRETIEDIDDLSTDPRTRFKQLRQALKLGAHNYNLSIHTVSLSSAIEHSRNERLDGSPTAKRDFSSLSRKLLRENPSLADRPLRAMTTQECLSALKKAFTTPSQFLKGRRMLHSVFSDGIKQGTCSVNPVSSISIPSIQEKIIKALNIQEIKALLSTCLLHEFLECAHAVLIMLFCGVRPTEVTRMKGRDINRQEGIVSVRFSKTGRIRHVTIHPVLKRFLTILPSIPGDSAVCPPNWINKWNHLRQTSGFQTWIADTLRHTFASYHAKYFKDFPLLQIEMGHRDSSLLRARYCNPEGITRKTCKEFWNMTPQDVMLTKKRRR